MKRASTTAPGPVDKKKNHKGQSFKTVWPGKDMPDDSGDSDTHSVTRRMTKGMRPGTGKKLPSKTEPAPYAERNLMKGSYRTVASAGGKGDSGAARANCIGAWCKGQRKSPK